MTRALVTQLLEALDESRDDVSQCLQEELPKAGYERYDRRIKAITEQLEKHDAAIEAAREYLATEPKPTLTEALAQQGIKLRTEFEPKQWDSDRSHLRFGGCPACGKRSCIARSCTTNEPTTRPLTLQERAEMESAGVTGELVKVLAFNDRPKAEPSGERAELIKKLRWASVVSGNETCGRAADMLEADAQAAKRVPMTDAEAHKTLLDMAANIEKFGDGTESNEQLSSECIRFILERVDHHGITPTEKSTDWGQP